jgi:hypothetical protein
MPIPRFARYRAPSGWKIAAPGRPLSAAKFLLRRARWGEPFNLSKQGKNTGDYCLDGLISFSGKLFNS